MATLKEQQRYYDKITSGKTIKYTPKKVKSLQTDIYTFDPLEAKHILKYYNSKNRKASSSQAGKYAKDMRCDNWLVTGQSITFTQDGVLQDGQHRLLASVESGMALTTVVVYGVEDRAFAVTDSGKVRTNGEILAMLGYDNSNELSALVRSIIAYNMGESPDMRTGRRFDGANSITKSELVEYVQHNENVVDYVAKYRKNQLVGASIASFCYWLFSETHSVKEAEDYLDKVLLGLHIEPNTIESYLFSKLQRNRNAHQNKMTKMALVSNIILGWRRHKGYSKSNVMQLNWDIRRGLPNPCKK